MKDLTFKNLSCENLESYEYLYDLVKKLNLKILPIDLVEGIINFFTYDINPFSVDFNIHKYLDFSNIDIKETMRVCLLSQYLLKRSNSEYTALEQKEVDNIQETLLNALKIQKNIETTEKLNIKLF